MIFNCKHTTNSSTQKLVSPFLEIEIFNLSNLFKLQQRVSLFKFLRKMKKSWEPWVQHEIRTYNSYHGEELFILYNVEFWKGFSIIIMLTLWQHVYTRIKSCQNYLSSSNRYQVQWYDNDSLSSAIIPDRVLRACVICLFRFLMLLISFIPLPVLGCALLCLLWSQFFRPWRRSFVCPLFHACVRLLTMGLCLLGWSESSFSLPPDRMFF